MCCFITFHFSLKTQTENEKNSAYCQPEDEELVGSIQSQLCTRCNQECQGIDSGISLVQAGFVAQSKKYAWALMTVRTSVWSTRMEIVKI